MIDHKNIPKSLQDRQQWVLWKMVSRKGQETKVPFQPNGEAAKSNDPATWCSFDEALAGHLVGGYDGIGFMFAEDDGLVGIDLDGCRDPETKQVAEWAREIILAFDTYAEVSPSKTGVKLFVVGKNPNASGKKKLIADVERFGDKEPAIEMYDRGRYFAVTGWQLRGPDEPQPADETLDWLASRYWPTVEPTRAPRQDFYSSSAVVERARRYVSKIPGAVSGQSGHNVTFHVACVLVLGFGLNEGESTGLMQEWNQSCQPPWSDRELQHKLNSAAKQPGERNYLRNVQPDQWANISVPAYKPVAATPSSVKRTTLFDACGSYIERLRAGKVELIDTGIADLDCALGGGVERGEVIVAAARPSHGKSMVALQAIHNWTLQGRNCLFVTEEMSAQALGKRSLQFLSDMPDEHWHHSVNNLESDLQDYASNRATCYIAEACGTTEAAVDQIDQHVAENQVECVVVDYAQLLRSPGKARYEQVSNTSMALTAAAKRNNIVLLVLCQMSRSIESRPKFTPFMSDIKESGQFEQDADVILFLVWPHRIDNKQDPHEYQIWVAKNRNRAINSSMVTCRFEPSRQRVVVPKVEGKAWDDWSVADSIERAFD